MQQGADRVKCELSIGVWESRFVQTLATVRGARDQTYERIQDTLDQMRDPEVVQECVHSAWHFATHPRESFELLQAKCQTTLQNLQQHAAQA